MLEIDAPVWVWVEGQEVWQPAHFARWETHQAHDDCISGSIGVWIQGRTSHSGFNSVVFYDKWMTDEDYRSRE